MERALFMPYSSHKEITEVDAKLKRKWVEALCSGEFNQGDGQLRNDNRYCCLGVLGSIAVFPYSAEGGFLCKSGVYVFLPEKIQEALAELNDDGVPFEVIAGLIDCAL